MHVFSSLHRRSLQMRDIGRRVYSSMVTNGGRRYNRVKNRVQRPLPPLHSAAKIGNLRACKWLVRMGADINKKASGCGFTPLMLACAGGHLKVAKFLVAKSARVESVDKNGCNALMHALIYQVYLREQCVESSAVAAHTRLLELCQLLVQREETAVDDQQQQPSRRGMVEGNGVNGSVQKQFDGIKPGVTPLYLAAYGGLLQLCQLLVQAGANTDQRTSDGETPLHAACKGGHLDIVQFLVEKVDIEMADEHGQTTLMVAVKSNKSVDIVQHLLDKHANIDHTDYNGVSALHLAANYGHQQMCEMLLSSGAKINGKDRGGMTPLHLACSKGHEGVCRLLVRNHASINELDRWGETPLMEACENGHFNVAQYLVEKCKADILIANECGRTALKLAKQGKCERIVSLLESKGVVR